MRDLRHSHQASVGVQITLGAVVVDERVQVKVIQIDLAFSSA